MTMSIARGVPSAVAQRAAATLKQVEQGRVHPRRLNNGRGMSVSVGRSYRLVKMANRAWELVTHESYNKLVGKR